MILEEHKSMLNSIAQKAELDSLTVRSVINELLSGGAASTTIREVAAAFREVGFFVVREGHSWNINL